MRICGDVSSLAFSAARRRVAARARAQQSRMPAHRQFLSSRRRDEADSLSRPSVQGLQEGGYIEGQNVEIDLSLGRRPMGRFPALAADLFGSR